MVKEMEMKVLSEDQLLNKVCVLVGTRPSMVKMSPIINALKERNIHHFVIHAGQHYSYNMDQVFFEDLTLSAPDYKLSTVKDYKLHGEQTAEMLIGIEQILLKEKPKLIFVCGDANFNLAGALAARKLGIKVAHVESGLRSNDWRMPEEHNRVMMDHISEYLFAPTEQAKENLIKDNVKGKIFVFGNTIVDAVTHNSERASLTSSILERLNLKKGNYILLTLHREENIDFKNTFKNIIEGLCLVKQACPNFQVVFPIHPRTSDRLEKFGLENAFQNCNIRLIEPVGYLDFLQLIKNAKLILTDSGGIQEEGCILKTPCVTIRENTERPETVKVGSNIVAGTNAEGILNSVRIMMTRDRSWSNPFGDGKTSKRMVEIIWTEVLEKNHEKHCDNNVKRDD